MSNKVETLKNIYEAFNARDIDEVLRVLSQDVAWANGMEGGHEHGREAVRAYWTRQWAIVRPTVEPVAFRPQADDSIAVEVRQSVRDLEGKPLQGQGHGLVDKIVLHIFHFRGDAIDRFDIGDDE